MEPIVPVGWYNICYHAGCSVEGTGDYCRVYASGNGQPAVGLCSCFTQSRYDAKSSTAQSGSLFSLNCPTELAKRDQTCTLASAATCVASLFAEWHLSSESVDV